MIIKKNTIMKTEKLYRAKSIKIGLIEGTINDYFIDIVDTIGNQRTIS